MKLREPFIRYRENYDSLSAGIFVLRRERRSGVEQPLILDIGEKILNAEIQIEVFRKEKSTQIKGFR